MASSDGGTRVWACGAAPASAHPHVWVTVKSQIAFTPDGKVSAVVHDWVFDEMYSSFATQGLAPAGQLVKKEQFAPLAKENAGSLAEIGYFTTLKIGGKSMDFDPVTDYWMQERPDHLVEFHVTLPLKTPTPITKFLTLRVSDPEFFIDFEFDDKEPVTLVSAPRGAQSRSPSPSRSRRTTSRNCRNRSSPTSRREPISASKWRAPPSSRAHDEARALLARSWMRGLGRIRGQRAGAASRSGPSLSRAARAGAAGKAASPAG